MGSTFRITSEKWLFVYCRQQIDRGIFYALYTSLYFFMSMEQNEKYISPVCEEISVKIESGILVGSNEGIGGNEED